MNSFFQILAPRAFTLIFAASVMGLAGCSKGTDAGDVNVERSGPKDNDPDELNREGGRSIADREVDTNEDPNRLRKDTANLQNDAYEHSKNDR